MVEDGHHLATKVLVTAFAGRVDSRIQPRQPADDDGNCNLRTALRSSREPAFQMSALQPRFLLQLRLEAGKDRTMLTATEPATLLE